jgi:hypothetical protein
MENGSGVASLGLTLGFEASGGGVGACENALQVSHRMAIPEVRHCLLIKGSSPVSLIGDELG